MQQLEYLSFNAKSPHVQTFRDWHAALVGTRYDEDAEKGDRGNPAALADLRRCRQVIDVLPIHAFHDLRRRLAAQTTIHDEQRDQLAVLAAAAGHVRRDDANAPLGKQMASTRKGGQLRVSELRFRRYIQVQANDPNALLEQTIRMVRLLGGNVNLGDLAWTILNWNHRDQFAQKQLAYAYFDNLP